MKTTLNLDLNRIVDIEVDGISHRDAPDYCDAYISEAWLPVTAEQAATIPGCEQNKQNGEWFRPLTDTELEWLNDQPGFTYGQVMKKLY